MLLSNNNLYGTLPSSHLASLQNLTALDLSHNELSGTIPTTVGLLRNAEEFMLNNNLLRGHAPTELGKLARGATTKFSLGVNPISGTLPRQLGDLTRLQYFDVAQTYMEGTLPALAPTVQVLHADHSPISGHLTPEMVGSMTTLRSLGLAGTRLSGTLPTELGQQWLSRVTFAGMSGLSGTIPTEIGKARGLRTFDASYTSLSGTVPSELFESFSLHTFNILGTSISGTLPPSFATMGSLRHLYVPRELTQYLRRKYCRQELWLPPSYNYFWDLADAAIDSRSRDADDCQNMLTVEEAFPLLTDDVPPTPSPSILQPPPPPSPLPPGEYSAHDVSIRLHLRPLSPSPPRMPPQPPALPGERYLPVVEAVISLTHDIMLTHNVSRVDLGAVTHALAHYLTVPDEFVIIELPPNGTRFRAYVDTSDRGMPERDALGMLRNQPEEALG